MYSHLKWTCLTLFHKFSFLTSLFPNNPQHTFYSCLVSLRCWKIPWCTRQTVISKCRCRCQEGNTKVADPPSGQVVSNSLVSTAHLSGLSGYKLWKIILAWQQISMWFLLCYLEQLTELKGYYYRSNITLFISIYLFMQTHFLST